MSADNFFFGVQANLAGVIDVFRVATQQKLFWGFVLGFVISSVIHAFLVAEHVRHIPTMMLSDASTSFQKLYPRQANAPFDQSFCVYSQNVERIKSMLYLCGLLIVISLLALMLSFK